MLIIATYAGISGASHSLIHLAKQLKYKGVVPIVIMPGSGPLEDLLNENDIKYKKFRLFNWVTPIIGYHSLKERLKWSLKRVINFFQEVRIFFFIKKNNIDLVHINAITADWGYIAAKISRKPIVWHIREFLEEDLAKRFWNKNKALKRLGKANSVIAISDSVANKYKRLIKDNEVIRIYNGIEYNDYDSIKNEIFQKEYLTISLAGRFVPEKGHEEAVYAVKKLADDGVLKVKLKFYGKEGQESYIKKIKTLIKQFDLENQVEFMGYRNDMHNVWGGTDIALVCSKAEAFGRVTVEALMAGALVIGANTEGTAEIISNKYGLLYEQGNYISLAENIAYAYKNKEAAIKIASQGQKFAKEKFTAEKNAESIYNIYEKLL